MDGGNDAHPLSPDFSCQENPSFLDDDPLSPDLSCHESPAFLYDDPLSPDLSCHESPAFLYDDPLSPDLSCQENPAYLYDDPLSPDLSCQESPKFLDEEVPVENTLISINNSIDMEIKFRFQRDEDLNIPNWVLEARSESITWILKRRTAFGFQSSIVYAFVAYFDWVISLRSIAIPIEGEKRVIRLLSVACLSLVVRMEGMKLPPLSQDEDEDYLFPKESIVKMEIGVLKALRWETDLITPFAFLDYLVSKLCQESPSDVKSQIAGHLLSVMTEINLMHHRPSAIAASATLMALDQNLTNEALDVKIKSVPDLKFLEIDAVFFCYHLMREMELRD